MSCLVRIQSWIIFFSSFVQESDILGKSERQAFYALPYLSNGEAERQFRSVIRFSYAGDADWAEAVQYILSLCATGSAMLYATLALREMKQLFDDSEYPCLGRLRRNAFYGSGNVLSWWERCSMFADALDPAISALCAHSLERNRKISYHELVYHV